MIIVTLKTKFKLMKNAILSAVAVASMFTATQANAQIQKDNLMVGANIANLDLGLQKGASVNFNLRPRLGYFIQDNVAIGGLLNLGVDYAKGRGTVVSYGIGAFGRYYLGGKQYEILKHTRFFGEANLGIGGKNTKISGSPAVTTNGLDFGVGPGIAYFLTPNVGLEALAKYNLTAGFGSAATVNRLTFEFGFQIYLPTKKARAIYNEVSDEVREKSK
jgi:hypothetical protein